MKTSCHLSKNAEKNTFVDHGVPFWLRFTYRETFPLRPINLDVHEMRALFPFSF